MLEMKNVIMQREIVMIRMLRVGHDVLHKYVVIELEIILGESFVTMGTQLIMMDVPMNAVLIVQPMTIVNHLFMFELSHLRFVIR